MGIQVHVSSDSSRCRRCDTRKQAIVDAGAIPPLLRTFSMGIPELQAHLDAAATEGDLRRLLWNGGGDDPTDVQSWSAIKNKQLTVLRVRNGCCAVYQHR